MNRKQPQQSSQPAKSGAHQGHKRKDARLSTIAADEFKQLLLKYVSRHAKSSRQFALLSIELANFETLADNSSDDPPRIMQAAQTLALDEAREADRLCLVSPATMLLLLPDTNNEGADQLESRLRQTFSNKIRPLAQTKPVFNFKITSSNDTACDVHAMLTAVGCVLDEHQDITAGGMTRAVWQLGSLESWMQRFALTQPWQSLANGSEIADADDNWSDTTVRMVRVQVPSDWTALEGNSPQSEKQRSLLQRARALQSLIHPNMQRLTDFFVDQGKHLYLVTEWVDGCPVVTKRRELTDKEFVDVAIEFASILIQAHSLVPLMVLKPTYENLLLCNGTGNLTLVNHHVEYLFPIGIETHGEDSNMSLFADFLSNLLAERTRNAVTDALSEILQNLQSAKRPESVSTLHKTRSAVKRIADQLMDSQKKLPHEKFGDA